MTEEANSDKKKPLTDPERLESCRKLNRELDDFINSLERERYTGGRQGDRGKEKINKHPFFMKSNPGGDEMSPLAEDPEENTPLELATSYKEDGNFNFKHKNYRLAILGYTEGIKVRCNNAEINANLYNNRSAAHWQLKNYRSAFFDSEMALSFNPNYKKSRLRAARAALEIARFDACLCHCEKLLEIEPIDMQVVKLLYTAKNRKAIKERDQMKKERMDLKKNEQREKIIKAIIKRGIKISNCDDADDTDLCKLEPTFPGSENSMVHIEDCILKWPVLFRYPEYRMNNFVRNCPENVSLQDHLEQLFPATWDKYKDYKLSKVNIYYEGYDNKPHLIDPTNNLGDILVMKYFELKAGTPTFFVLPRGSLIERKFKQCHV